MALFKRRTHSLKFNKGDLVHIPEAVFLWDKKYSNNTRTQKPSIGVFVGACSGPAGEDQQWMRIYAKGQNWNVLAAHLYPLQEAPCWLS